MDYKHALAQWQQRRERIKKLAKQLPLIEIAKRYQISRQRVQQIVKEKCKNA